MSRVVPLEDPVYEQLRGAIVEGRYEPGMRLVEQSVARDLGVSRTPVREALRRLDADGLIVSERNRGAVVRRVTAAELDDLYELRGRLESYAAELAAQRRTASQIDALRAASAAFAAAAAVDGDGPAGIDVVRRLNAANRAFHDGVVAAAAHDRLAAMLRGTVDVPLVFRALRSFDAAQQRRSALFHHLIADAIELGEPARAARLMAEHIAQGRDAVRAALTADDGRR